MPIIRPATQLGFGYDVVKEFGADGKPVGGKRVINEDHAVIIRRIFDEYCAGKSPQSIAIGLNRDGLRGPFGKEWGPSAINGNKKRGSGILNRRELMCLAYGSYQVRSGKRLKLVKRH